MAQQVLGHDSAKAGRDKINTMFGENYASIEDLVSKGFTADQIAAIRAASAPSAGNPFATMADGGGSGGGGTVSLTAGKILTGYIQVMSTDNGAGTAQIKVAAGTTVFVPSHKHGGDRPGGIVPLNAGTFTLTMNAYNDQVVYCDYAGVLYVAREANLPGGPYITLFRTITWYGSFNFKPILPTNHYFPVDNSFRNPEIVQFINMLDFGAVGDDATINNDALLKVGIVCMDMLFAGVKTSVYFPDGIYRFSNDNQFSLYRNITVVGQSKLGTILKSLSPDAPVQINLSNAQSITFLDVHCADFSQTDNAAAGFFGFDDCVFKTNTTNTSYYHFYFGANAFDSIYQIIGCDFVFPHIYAALWLYHASSWIIKGCTFNGNAWHNVRIEPSVSVDLGVMEITDNHVKGGTTGIFIGSNRSAPIENVLIENNVLLEQMEESISFDGFGNNTGLCPTIISGTITGKSNDANGRLVIQADWFYHDGTTPNQPYTLDARDDWKKFYFTLEDGSGREGVVAKIYDFYNGGGTPDTITLDLYTPASAIIIGGQCGVQAGFFNCKVRANKITGSVGAGNNYATALSIYLNVFGMIIEDNVISGCNIGINLAGGLMLSTYRTLAYNNIVKNNSFLACNEVAGGSGGVVNFRSYGATVKQYGNQFVSNTIVGGALFFEMQKQFIFESNNLRNATAQYSYCGNALPTADASQLGRVFMLITDNSGGVPTAVNYYVCKLTAGVYSWVAL